MVTLIGYDIRRKEDKVFYIEYIKYNAEISAGECVAQVFNSADRHDRLFGQAKIGDQIPGLKVGYDREKKQNFVYSVLG